MPKQYINPPSLFPSRQYGFSQVVAARGKRTLYVSGQTAWDAQRKLIGGADLSAQARQAFRNVQTAVEAGGGNLEDVVSLRIYVVDYNPEKAEAVGAALRDCFHSAALPATWIGVVSLADPGFMIEVEAIAVNRLRSEESDGRDGQDSIAMAPSIRRVFRARDVAARRQHHSKKLKPEVHLYLGDRYERLAHHLARRGSTARANRLTAKARWHYERAGLDDPPRAAAMAMPGPRPRIFTDA